MNYSDIDKMGGKNKIKTCMLFRKIKYKQNITFNTVKLYIPYIKMHDLLNIMYMYKHIYCCPHLIKPLPSSHPSLSAVASTSWIH